LFAPAIAALRPAPDRKSRMYIENFADLPYIDRRIPGLTETPKQIAQIAKE